MAGFQLARFHTAGHFSLFQPFIAQVALLDDALSRLELSYTIGAYQHAKLAANATLAVYNDNPVGPSLAGPGRTAVDTGCILAVHTRPRQMV
jgi:hypothetical protein